MKHFCLFLFIVISIPASAQLYLHDFGNTTISAYPYNTAPYILQTNLSASSWTNSTGAWTSFAGNTGQAIALSNSGGIPTITLNLTIATGYTLNISSFNFWQQRSATGAQNWSMTINGIAAGAGTIPTTGAATGITPVTNPVNNLSGAISVVIALSGASATGTYRLDDFTLNGTVVPKAYVLLDNFNRNDTIRPGKPSSGGSAWWVEQEAGLFCSVLQLTRIKSNQLELSNCTYSNSTCFASPTTATAMDMTGKYPTIFANAASTMEWYFNMQQSRIDPNGFGAGEFGAAFVIGSSTFDIYNPAKSGYAVIYGESGTTDPIRLVSFNGSVFNSSTFTNILSVPSPAVKTNYMSIKVSFNPCNSEWSLTVRDDGAAFADPSTVSGVGATAINSTFTSSNLLWMGAVWNYSNSACNQARFDNFYIPNTGTSTGTYTWNGSGGTDFQSPYNWTPARQCSKPTDILVINSLSPSTSIISNIPVQTISQFTVTNNRTVTLRDVPADGIASTLTVTGAAGTDLQVDAGSTIIFDAGSAAATDGLVVNLGAGATGSLSGTVSFNSQFAGTPPHRLLASDALAITVNNGGMIRAMALSGNPFGSSLPQNTVVFNSGAIYECYSGANPFGLTQPGSKLVFNTGSTYRHFSTNQPSLLGRVYANFESNTSFNITLGGTGVFTVDHLRILGGTMQLTGMSNSQPIHTNIKGDLTLAAGTGLNYDPVVPSNFTFNGSIAPQNINSIGTLTLGRHLTVKLNSSYATAPQLTVETDIDIAGILDITQGQLKLAGNIQLLSDSTSTAAIAPITGDISYGAGRFIVQRYIPKHGKAWQLLAIPTTGQTINGAWQEGNGPMIPGTPGFGTIITSNVAGTGFDLVGGFAPSMKTYDTAGTGSWKGISRTDTAIYNMKGYMIFIRGDRTVTGANDPATATILRTKGMLFDPVTNQPPITMIGADKFESIGNPYASAIDFSNESGVVKSANVQRIFYTWDPRLGGGSGYGGYQTFIKSSGGDYTVSPGGGSYGPGGSVCNTIESGQAFFVHTVGNAGTVTFMEAAKASGSRLVTRQNNVSLTGSMLRTTLYGFPGSSRVLIDGVLQEFGREHSNGVDILDALKMVNTGESMGITVGTRLLAVERRAEIRNADTIFYNLRQLNTRPYELEFQPVNLFLPGIKAFLEDAYLGTVTPVSLDAVTTVQFEVNGNPASAAPGRFRLLFRQNRPSFLYSKL